MDRNQQAVDVARHGRPANSEVGGSRAVIRMRDAWTRVVRVGIVAALPATTLLLLVWLLFHRSIFDAGFSSLGIWNDELYYWHQIATFRDHGFAGGYYTFSEVPAPLFSRFGPEGPAYPVLFGSLARVFGWHYYSPALFHLVILTAAVAALVYFTELRGIRLLVAALLYLSFWPLMFFTATPMEEGLHYAIASVLAILFHRLIILKTQLTRTSHIAWLAFLAYACLLRPTWSVLFFPFFAYSGGRSLTSFATAAFKGIVGVVASFSAYAYLTAPYPYGFLQLLRGQGVSDQFRLVRQHAADNLEEILRPGGTLLVTPLQRLQHAQVAALLVLLCVAGVALLRLALRRTNGSTEPPGRWAGGFPLLFHLANLGAVAIALVLMYDVGSWRDYRTMAPHLLLSMLVSVATLDRRWLALPVLFIISNLVFTPAFIHDFRTYREGNFTSSFSAVETFRESLAGEIRYRPGVNPWCNTVLSSWPGGEALPREVLGLPSGIGVSLDYSGAVPAPLKSAYVLTSPENYELLAQRTRLVFLSQTSHGNLYLNSDSGCFHVPLTRSP